MTKQKSTKRALILSALTLLMCVSMLIGSTLAWFTDSVTSGNNKIVAGNLDVVLEYKTGVNGTWTEVTEDTKLFKNDALFEPGYTETVFLRVSNAGALAFKYQLMVDILDEKTSTNINGEKLKLSDYLQFGAYVMDESFGQYLLPVMFSTRENALNFIKSADGTGFSKLSTADSVIYSDRPLLAGEQTAQVMALVLTMPETVGNEANYDVKYEAPKINLGVSLVATQYTDEFDSFDNQYDKNSEYPDVEYVIENGISGGIVWTLTDAGTLTISPVTTPTPDANSGKTFEVGAWREAVIYNSNGGATAIGGYPYDVNAVKSLVIEEGVTSIGSFTAKFPNLTGEVIIPSTVTYIGQEAFQNAPINKVTFAKGGTETLCIAPGAFKNLAVEEIVLPDDRPEIHIHCWAFNNCKKLKRITFPANITTFTGWTHVDYCGMNFINGWDSQILAYNPAIENIIFGSQAVHDLFFNSAGNKANIDALNSVTIEVKK